MKSIFFLFLTICSAGSVHAASFDCTKASSKMEKAICESAELSRMDEVLALSYKSAKERLSTQASGTLTKGQISWLRFTSNYCFVDYDASAVPASVANKCLVDTFGLRIKELDSTGRMIAGYKSFLMINDSIKIVRTEKYIYTIQQIYPQFDSVSEQAIKLNKFLADIEVAKLDDSRGSESYEVSLNTPSRDWLVKDVHADNMIGPYPESTHTCSVYSLGLGRVVRVGDVFVNSAWQRIARDVSVEHFKALASTEKDFPLEMVSGYEQFALDPAKEFQFCIDAKGIFVEGFLPHVARAFDGVTIGWDRIKAVLTPYAREQVQELIGR